MISPPENRSSSLLLLIALITGSCVAYSGLYAMPLWIGALADHLNLDPATAGYMGSLQLLMAAFAAIFIARQSTKLSVRQIALYGCLLVLIANLASALLSNTLLLFLARGMSGIGEGLLLANLNMAISRTKTPDRFFALSQTTIALFGIGLFLAAPGLMSDFGSTGIFGIVVITSLIALPASLLFANQKEEDLSTQTPQEVPERRWLRFPAVPLLALGILFIGCQGGWAYLERMGVAKGYQVNEIGDFIMIGLLISILGPFAANQATRYFGRRAAIIIGLSLSGIAVLFASQNISPDYYRLAAAVFPFATLFIVTSYLGYLAHLDSSGAMAASAPAFINLGGALGPAAMGLMLTNGGYPVIGGAVILTYICALVLLFIRKEELHQA
ncbi:MFS transporter [Paremcibacter congregatus]|uniref:MFS transporter n=1 Tax=Paremcibacter congregatus TaxID=2043170 RepID=UPI0030EDCD51|tara:strand:+ start:24544 stop:25701 length:1158 start_codon:yes stop_codon:yes gene_type:complete